MTDVFISYAKPDRPVAEGLAADLIALQFNVWWDANLYASQDYHDAIMEALKASKAVVVIWSPNAVKSPWVRDEATRKCREEARIDAHRAFFSGQHSRRIRPHALR